METVERIEKMKTFKTEAWSGNVKPWKSTVYIDGVFAGRSGFCKTPGAAQHAAEVNAAKRAALKASATV